MNKLITLPNDVLKHEIMQYLTVHDIVILDNSCLNHKYRIELMKVFHGIILIGTKHEDISIFFHWLIIKEIFMKNIYIKHNSSLLFTLNDKFLTYVQNFHLDNLKYINCNINRCKRHCFKYNVSYINYQCLNKCKINNNFVVNLYKWKSLISLQLMDCSSVTDNIMKQITKNCFSLLHLSLCSGSLLTNDSLKYILDNNNKLHSLNLSYLPLITDEIIILILSNSNMTINSLIFDSCPNITNNCIQYISTYCNKLNSLEIINSMNISSALLINLVNNSNTIKSLIIINCKKIIKKDIFLLAYHCFNLKTFFFKYNVDIIAKNFN